MNDRFGIFFAQPDIRGAFAGTVQTYKGLDEVAISKLLRLGVQPTDLHGLFKQATHVSFINLPEPFKYGGDIVRGNCLLCVSYDGPT